MFLKKNTTVLVGVVERFPLIIQKFRGLNPELGMGTFFQCKMEWVHQFHMFWAMSHAQKNKFTSQEVYQEKNKYCKQKIIITVQKYRRRQKKRGNLEN